MKRIHENCLICVCGELKPLKNYKNHYLVKCHNCKFVFSQQIPTKEELDKCYGNYSRKDYLSATTIKRYNELLDIFEKYRKTNRILDVGCGIGYFLDAAKDRGWEVYGTEYTEEAVKICIEKGINTMKGTLDVNNYSEGMFDVITSFEVIEHIYNPIEDIDKIKILLRQEGALYITTPNFNSIERYYLKSNYSVICYPEHLSYYTKGTLNYLLRSQGFKKIYIKATGISITRLRRNAQDKHYISPTSDDEKARNIFERNCFTKRIKGFINWFLSVTGIGNSIKGLYCKPN